MTEAVEKPEEEEPHELAHVIYPESTFLRISSLGDCNLDSINPIPTNLGGHVEGSQPEILCKFSVCRMGGILLGHKLNLCIWCLSLWQFMVHKLGMPQTRKWKAFSLFWEQCFLCYVVSPVVWAVFIFTHSYLPTYLVAFSMYSKSLRYNFALQKPCWIFSVNIVFYMLNNWVFVNKISTHLLSISVL